MGSLGFVLCTHLRASLNGQGENSNQSQEPRSEGSPVMYMSVLNERKTMFMEACRWNDHVKNDRWVWTFRNNSKQQIIFLTGENAGNNYTLKSLFESTCRTKKQIKTASLRGRKCRWRPGLTHVDWWWRRGWRDFRERKWWQELERKF